MTIKIDSHRIPPTKAREMFLFHRSIILTMDAAIDLYKKRARFAAGTWQARINKDDSITVTRVRNYTPEK